MPARPAELDRDFTFNIVAEPLESALMAVSQQADTQAVIAPDAAGSAKAPALSTLLRSTGLKYAPVGKSVSVTRVGEWSPLKPEFVAARVTPTDSSESAHDTKSWEGAPSNNPSDQVRVAQADQAGQEMHSQSSFAANKTSKDRPIKLEEVVVTASKREETVKEVPASITALTGINLEKLGVVDFQDYMPYVPSLSQNQNNQPGYSSTIIRGLNSGSSQTTATVGYYLDDTPITPSSPVSTGGYFTPDPDLGDLERIEVLKGPQSTLYGAMTLGGLVKIVSKKPDLTRYGGDFSVSGVTLTNGGSGASVRGALNIPLVQDALAARVSAYYRYDPGFTDNVFRGNTNVNTDHAHGARLSLRYQPIEKLDFELSGLIQNFHAVGNTQEFLDLQTLKPIYQTNQYATPFNEETSTQTTLLSLKANYDTKIGTLVNSLGFGRYYTTYDLLDFTPTFGFYLPLFFGIDDPNVSPQGNNYKPETKKLTDELRFVSKRMGKVEWLLGLFYTHEKISWPYEIDFNTYPNAELLPSPPNPFGTGSLGGTYSEYAGFGDLTYYLTDALDVTVGTRYSQNRQNSVNTAGPPDMVVANVDLSASDETYLFDLRWRPSGSLSTYLRVASGYRPGGPQILGSSPTMPLPPGIPTSFGPDTAWNYEVGAKGQWLDGKLNANLAVYYLAWRNIQLNTTYLGSIITGNGGNAKSEGVEFESSYQPVRGLVIGASAAFDETAMTSIDPTNSAGAQLGDPLPYTPKWSGALTGDYTFPLAPNVKGAMGASWLYRGWRYNSFSGDLLNTRETLPAYSLFSLRGHLDWSRYSLLLHIDNVANKQTYSNITIYRAFAGQSVPGYATVIEPRTIRLTLNVSL